MDKIGAGDSSVPAIQMSDINDGEIINGTQQELDDKGRARFHYVMPDGSPLSSDWVMPDFIKQARRQWVEAVKSNLVAFGQRANDEATKHLRNKMLEETSIDIPETTPVRRVRNEDLRGAATSSVGERVFHPTDDPVAHAKASLVKAAEEAQYWQEIEDEAAKKKTAAEAAVKKWTKVLAVLGED